MLILAVVGGFFAYTLMWLGVYLRPEHRGLGPRKFMSQVAKARNRSSAIFAGLAAWLIGATTFLLIFD